MSPRLAALLLCGLSAAPAAPRLEPGPGPLRVYSLRADALERAKRRIQAGDSGLRPAYERLVREANDALTAGPFSVMDKQRIPPSGDKHDYVSMGPYWWPDLTKPDSLPYIRRDGERNPEIARDYDAPRFGALTGAVTTLSLAYYFTDDERYAERAVLLVRAWFLDPATRMNPHLRYGQRIPGITEGRAAGIIETRRLVELVDALGTLEPSPSWSDADERGMRAWMAAYLQWLRTSDIGREEQRARNNHGTWYDAQVVALALFTNDTALARATLEASKTRRIGSQITADGRQPYELVRTRSLAYSMMNLEGLCRLAELGRNLGADLWAYASPDGGSIRKALDYVAPYADPARKWAGRQITPIDPGSLVLLLERASLAYDSARYSELLRLIPADEVRSHRARLEYPEPDTRRSLVAPHAPAAAQRERATVAFDRAWRFHLGDVSGAQAATFDDSGWRSLEVPHDWSIEGEFSDTNPAGASGGALPGGVAWYRKAFSVAERDTGRLVFIEFDGIYRNSEVWINGHYLGKRPYGYSSFHYELTRQLRYGPAGNVIAVRVDNSQQPNSRWYSGSGIYRHVRLVTTDPVHVDHWGTYVTTPEVTPSSARVTTRTTIRNASHADQPITLRTVVYDTAGREVATASSDGRIPADSVTEIAQELLVRSPTLWSVERPSLYRAVSRVTCRTRLCDDYTTPFGVRTFSFDADRGFILNGKQLKIRGVCLHHDLGALGAAVNTRALERQLQIMKEMGVNAIRTSHNPPAPELLDLTDRMGFIVLDEAFDMWKKQKTKFDYHLDWDAWHVHDLSDMVRRDRNHPSVFMWSIGNEVMEQWTDGDTTAAPIARELAGIVRRLDPTRPITSANNNGSPANPLFHAGALDLLGHNYHHQAWPNLPAQFPGEKLIITEAMSALNSRGFYEQPSDSVASYETPYVKDRGPQPNKDYRLSSYDDRKAFWGSLHEESLRLFERYPFLSGMFIWSGIDYLGEPTPYEWPARSSYFGVVDLAGFPKDPFYLYQSEWTDRPMLHVFPHWNWTAGDTIDVWAYTNGDEAELFLNGASLGVRRKESDVFHLMWRVAYTPGTLRAVARKGGRVMATQEVKTAGAAARIALAPDRSRIHADGNDLAFVTVTVLDRAGVVVPTADHLVRFRLTGDARIAGVDNGDQISHAPFHADRVRLFNGKALVVVRAAERAGTVLLTAEADGLEPATTHLELRGARPPSLPLRARTP